MDSKLIRAVDEGPPYAVGRVDDNPFEKGEIAVAASDALGHAARDKVVLEPFEVLENAQLTIVLSR